MPSTTQTIAYYASDERVILILIVAALAVLAARKKWRAATELALAFGLARIASVALKHALAVPRPAGALFDASGFSFPSGHAAVAAALAILLYAVAQTHLCSRGARFLVDFLLLLAIFLVAASRLWFGVHALPDVLAGTVLGALAGLAALAVGRFLARRSQLFHLPPGRC